MYAAEGAPRLASGCRYPRASDWGALLAQIGEEEGLVDAALEDGHAQLHALIDDFATLHTRFASELGGRQVDCHRYEPPVCFGTFRQGTASSGRTQRHYLNLR